MHSNVIKPISILEVPLRLTCCNLYIGPGVNLITVKGCSSRNQLVQTNYCSSPGHSITYECTVCGPGATVWTGSIFNCRSGGITLRHHLFGYDSDFGAQGECNNGAVTAHSVGVVNTNNTDCYISQLNVMSTTYFTDISNKTVTCLHVNGTHETVVDTRKFRSITGIIIIL